MADNVIPTRRATVYNSIESSISAGIKNQSVAFGDVVTAYFIQVTNDDDTDSLSVRLNAGDNPYITVKAGETQVFNFMKMTSLWLSNLASGNLSYRIVIVGDAN